VIKKLLWIQKGDRFVAFGPTVLPQGLEHVSVITHSSSHRFLRLELRPSIGNIAHALCILHVTLLRYGYGRYLSGHASHHLLLHYRSTHGCALNIGPERNSTIEYNVLSRDNVEKRDYLRENKTLGILLLRTLRKVAVLKSYGIVFRKSDCLSGF
jgi:hypothetical protein